MAHNIFAHLNCDSDSDSEPDHPTTAPTTPKTGTTPAPTTAPVKRRRPQPLSQLQLGFSFPDRRPQRYKKPATQADLARQTGLKIKHKTTQKTTANVALAHKPPTFDDKNFPKLPDPVHHHVDTDHLDALRRNGNDVATLNHTRKILDFVQNHEDWQRRHDAFAALGNPKQARKWAGPPPQNPFAPPPTSLKDHEPEEEDDSYAYHFDDMTYDRVQHGIYDNAWSSDSEEDTTEHDDTDDLHDHVDPYDPVGDGHYGRDDRGFGLRPRGQLVPVIDKHSGTTTLRGKYGDRYYYQGPNATGDHTPAVATKDYHGRLRYAPATGDDVW